MRGGTYELHHRDKSRDISIHPPRAGRDRQAFFRRIHIVRISIHPPRAGRDTIVTLIAATLTDFNPPAPCGAGLFLMMNRPGVLLFQSTRPVRGGTHMLWHLNGGVLLFQSTRPVRGGTVFRVILLLLLRNFNPPAPCGAGLLILICRLPLIYFNPPAPCGAGQILFSLKVLLLIFQSTRPVRGGTLLILICRLPLILFQSTRPVRGGTGGILCIKLLVFSFQSTRPVRGGTFSGSFYYCYFGISIHPPRAGRDLS